MRIEVDAEGNIVNPLETSPVATPITGSIADNLIINQELILSGETPGFLDNVETVEGIETVAFSQFNQSIESGNETGSIIVNVVNPSNVVNY